MVARTTKKKPPSKRKPVVGFSVSPELDAKIEAYANENGFTKSAAMRHMVIVFFRNDMSFSNIELEAVKS